MHGYAIPTPNSYPKGIAIDGGGTIWFTQANANKIAKLVPLSGAFSEFQIPTPFANPETLTVDGSDRVWFVELRTNRLSAFYPEDERFYEALIPTTGGLPNAIEVDDRGSIWFLEYLGNKVGVFDPLSARFKEFTIPTFASLPSDIAIDNRRDRLWFSQSGTEAKRLGMLSLKKAQTAMAARTPAIATRPSVDDKSSLQIRFRVRWDCWSSWPPRCLAHSIRILAADHKMKTAIILYAALVVLLFFHMPKLASLNWASKHIPYRQTTRCLQELPPTLAAPSGSLKPTPISWPNLIPKKARLLNLIFPPTEAFLLDLTTDASGVVWFLEQDANQLGRFDPAVNSFREFDIPTIDSVPRRITSDDNGVIWFTEFFGNNLSKFDPLSESFKEYPIPTPNSQPTGLVVGPKGVIWLLESQGNKLASFDPTSEEFREFLFPEPFLVAQRYRYRSK